MLRKPIFDELRIATHLAWRDLRSRYAQTVLGPWWSMINLAVVLAGSSIAVALISGTSPSDQAPRIAIGLTVWTLISTSLSDAATLFESERGILLNTTVTEVTMALQLVLRNGIVFLYNAIVIALTFILSGKGIDLNFFVLIPVLVLTSIALILPVLLVARWSIVVSDFKIFLPSVIQFSFFLTPVLWTPPSSGLASQFTALNPLAWPLELAKLTILEGQISVKYLGLLTAFSVIGGFYSIISARNLQSIRNFL